MARGYAEGAKAGGTECVVLEPCLGEYACEVHAAPSRSRH